MEKGKPLVNIVMAEIVTEETTPRTYRFKTASTASVEPFLSEGNEEILRVKNEILATNRTEDIVVGYNTTLSQSTLIPEVMAIVDGGELVMDATEPEKVVGYLAPAAGAVVERVPFTLNLYSEEKDIDGSTVEYIQLQFKHNTGTPMSWNLQDGEFFVPELVMRSRPKAGENPMSVDFMEELPAEEV